MSADMERRGSDSTREKHGPPVSKAPRIDSRELLNGGTELIIVHEGREYRLRITQNRKLILVA